MKIELGDMITVGHWIQSLSTIKKLAFSIISDIAGDDAAFTLLGYYRWRETEAEKAENLTAQEIVERALQLKLERGEARELAIEAEVKDICKRITKGDFILMNDGRLRLGVMGYLPGMETHLPEVCERLLAVFPNVEMIWRPDGILAVADFYITLPSIEKEISE